MTSPYPPPGHPAAAPPPSPGGGGGWRPETVEPLPGTAFGLVRLEVAPITSGRAIGALIAGIGSVAVALLVLCFGLAGAANGWGPAVAGAFTLLGVLSGAGAITLGLLARRQIRVSGRDGRVRFTGAGLAVAGVSCGAAGAGISLLCLLLVALVGA